MNEKTIGVGAAVAMALLAGLAGPAAGQERHALPFPDDMAETVKDFFSDATTGVAGKLPTIAVEAIEAIDAIETQKAKAVLESICGPDDSQDVELYDGTLGPTQDFVAGNEPSTAQFQWNSDLAQKFPAPNADAGNVSGKRWCTGTMISPNEMLTAGHCFDQTGNGWRRPRRLIDGQWVIIEPNEIASNMHVNFGYQVDKSTGAVRTPMVFAITALDEYRIGGLDFAIVRIGADGKQAGDVYGVRAVATTDAANGTPLTVIQHPAGNPKKIEAGPLDFLIDGLLHYGDLDTQGGSSGSGVLDPAGALVGVHVMGGCVDSGIGHNKAVSIMAIRAASNRL
ncbi:trypsin-like peptidase domain-containing protein [Mesorhizobium sp. LHD-90]|uniref:trypsin-like serine peptidase n=1 Tax=Mesorhizobium sp. LHD-90 TaxID=3071414 RepID=UPI0027E04AE0|nr:trypsin-like peptidase domain-containing protein [Mesorhizobium sp. LHD-90]MDQ6436121.1 trypsin-like peptidase domain-containing protein [Mesorhizobium sp. LHD-90]